MLKYYNTTMGVTCCNRIEDPEQMDNFNNKIIYPINSYLKDDLLVPEDYLSSSNKNKNSHEKPHNIPENAYHLRVYACYDENIFPIWVDIGTSLSFQVSGHWYLFNGTKKIGPEGDHENQDVMDFPLGCLLGHVQGGECFMIENKLKYTSKSKGYLMMFQNNGSYETNPFGYLDVYVTGGKIYKYHELERLSGWNYNIIDTNEYAYYLSEKEKDLVILLNKLRTNPAKFAAKYLSHLVGMNTYYEETYNTLISMQRNYDEQTTDKGSTYSNFESERVLKSDLNIYKIAEKHGSDLDKTGTVGHTSAEGLKLEERLKSFGVESNCFSEVCSFGKSCPIGILLQLLVDDEDINNSQNRETLIENNFSHVGVSIQKHKTYGYSCVITLVKL